ncbi:MAG: hypothetical protein N3D84_00325 [Candidatus Woesearchaeota archaeon]|nr:hypothetical protein [Candidatus Woesearchaeota archaeon]
MVIKVEGITTKVKYYGIFDLKELYRMVRDKLVDEGYISEEKAKDNMMENYYSEKRSSDPREAKTIWIWWRTKKKEEGSPFYEQRIDVDFHLRYIKDVEVLVDGDKKRVLQGEVEVKLIGDLYIDPDDKWKNHWLLSSFLDFMVRRIWRKQRESRKNSVISDVMKIQAMVKEFFEIKHFMPLKPVEPFYPLYGYKIKGEQQ